MKREKLFKITASIMLAFGWLFMSPAYSDDPISLAYQEIEDLNDSIDDLGYKNQFISLIDIAEEKYDAAVAAKQSKDSSFTSYDNALSAKATALQEKSTAQSAVDGQTVTVATALTNKNNAQDALDAANINLSTAQSAYGVGSGGAGLSYTVYSLVRSNNNYAATGSVLCTGIDTTPNSMSLPVCGNRYENFIVVFDGVITVPSWFTSTKFAGYTDDGFKMSVDGDIAINNWVEQGPTWSAYSPIYDVSVDKTLQVQIWWYNGGGPGSYHLGWAIPGGWTGAGCDYAGTPRVWGENFSCDLNTFSYGSNPTQEQTNAYNAAVAAQAAAQAVYDDKLSVYNSANSTLTTYNQTLTTKTNNYNTAVSNVATALQNKNNDISAYNQAINNVNIAIDDAWRYYDEQSQRELNAAMAQAAANAAANQPKPEPSPEPKPTVEPEKPKPEPTDKPEPKPTVEPEKPKPSEEPKPKPSEEPKPQPSEEPKPKPSEEPKPKPSEEPKPTPAPSPEPKPEPPLEPPVEPSPEPKPLPRPEFKPAENVDPVIKNAVLAALIPQKGTGNAEDLSGVIANLTSKENKLIKLSVEQTAAVSQTLKSLTQEAKAEVAADLGIAPAEVAKVAEAMKSNFAVAEAFVEFTERAGDAGETPMPFTLADAVTEVQTEAFLADPLGAVFEVDVTELLSNFSELGVDMTDDQREKAQEVIVPVIIVSQIAGAMIRRKK